MVVVFHPFVERVKFIWHCCIHEMHFISAAVFRLPACVAWCGSLCCENPGFASDYLVRAVCVSVRQFMFVCVYAESLSGEVQIDGTAIGS